VSTKVAATVRLLLIEDDVRLAQLVKDYLTQENFSITVEHRGDRALENFDPDAVDIVILDLMLPGMDGLKVCSGLRRVYHGPILILTAKSSDIDHVMGLELGADDFVHKPIEPPVLLARLRALLRRTQNGSGAAESQADNLTFGTLSINVRAHEVKLGTEIIDFTTQEFELLHFLARNSGKVLSRDDIFNNIRGIEYDGLDRTVDVRISRLRKKLQDNPSQPQRIKTVWGKGYLFVGDAWN
jgi:DNA-binding response OmpR family regulator